MSQPVVYAVVAMVCYGLGDFIYKRAAAAGIRADHILMVQGWIFFPLVVLYTLATNQLVFTPAALWGLLAGALIFAGLYYFNQSFVAGSVSTNATIFRLNFIVTALLVIAFLGEPLTPSKIAGLVLALLATWLLVGSEAATDAAPNDGRRRSLVQVIVAALLFGASNFFQTIGLRQGANPETLIVAQAVVYVLLSNGTVYFTDRRIRSQLVTLKYGAAVGALVLAATIFLLHGVARGQASVLVPIAQMGFIVAALLGIFVLREPVTIRKTTGIVSALAGLALLAGS